ncbi:MAG: family 16 glycoside hydrolase, partial [Fimbriiglobus sp.]
IALQCHNRDTVVEFRKVEARDITPPGTGPKAYQTKFLSELQATDVRTYENKFPPAGQTFGNGRISVQGKESPHGLFLHPISNSYSNTTYRLDRKWSSLSTKVASLNPGPYPGTALTFTILGDGKVLWKSDPVTRKNQPQDCRISVAGVTELSLRVYCPGTDGGAWSVWIEPQLSEEPIVQPSGDFTPLFNGRDLTGWSVASGDPRNWSVVDGVLVGAGPKAPSRLVSDAAYTNLHVRAECRLSGTANGTIYVRAGAAPGANTTTGYGAQLNTRVTTGAAPTGSLYDGGSILQRTADQSVRPGEWFTYEIIADGPGVKLLVNGVPTAGFTDPKARHTTGRVVLEQFSPDGTIEFRKVEIRSIGPKPAVVPVEVGFTPLLNGKDLTGWEKPNLPDSGVSDWRVENGTLVGSLLGSANDARNDYNLRTTREYDDFCLRAEVKLGGTNSGIILGTGTEYKMLTEVELVGSNTGTVGMHSIRPNTVSRPPEYT